MNTINDSKFKISVKAIRDKLLWNKKIETDRFEKELYLDNEVSNKLSDIFVNADINGKTRLSIDRYISSLDLTHQQCPWTPLEMWIDFGNNWKIIESGKILIFLTISSISDVVELSCLGC